MFVDNSVGMTYRGRALADPVRNYGTAFSNMHRELHRIYVDGNVVVVQLACRAPTMAHCSSRLGTCLPRASKWTHRAATCSARRR
jgi:hypothetical protein